MTALDAPARFTARRGGAPPPAPQAPRRSAGERGFSLIELMVVIVIIGIIAALAVPSMRIATYDRHAYDDAGSIMQLFRAARTRAIARGAAVVVSMATSNNQTERGTFTMYEAVVGPGAGMNPPGIAGTPVSACKAPTVWPNPLPAAGVTNTTARLVDGVNLNGTPESDADIQTTITFPPSTVPATSPQYYICYTPLGRSYLSDNLVFTAANLRPLQVLVRRLAAGGTPGGRSVIVLPNGSTRIFSHVATL